MDSYQNLLFSIARFREFTGYFPSKITVVGYEFKKLRFTELHREALRWPKKKFNYIGVDPDHENHANVLHGEVPSVTTLWKIRRHVCTDYLFCSDKTDIFLLP